MQPQSEIAGVLSSSCEIKSIKSRSCVCFDLVCQFELALQIHLTAVVGPSPPGEAIIKLVMDGSLMSGDEVVHVQSPSRCELQSFSHLMIELNLRVMAIFSLVEDKPNTEVVFGLKMSRTLMVVEGSLLDVEKMLVTHEESLTHLQDELVLHSEISFRLNVDNLFKRNAILQDSRNGKLRRICFIVGIALHVR